jgi:UDP-N-acetylglucosamine 2-epimerase (non-hydrolysing)
VEFDKVLDNEKPDAVLVLGDTNSALSVICAKKRKIPIFHVEAGNRCFDQRVPEEVNRKIVDHIADINLTYSSYASENLILEGISKDKIIKIGSPLYEVYQEYSNEIEKSKILEKINIKKNNFILVSLHRQENLEDINKLCLILKAIIKLKKKLKIPVIFSTHPRTKKIIKKFDKIFLEQINFYKPFGFFDYAKMMMNSRLVISDSGSITEETSILSIPSINLRSSNERQEGMEFGTVIMSGLKLDDILNSCDIAIKRAHGNFQLNTFTDYKNANVSDSVVTIIQSYTHYINSKFWFK